MCKYRKNARKIWGFEKKKMSGKVECTKTVQSCLRKTWEIF